MKNAGLEEAQAGIKIARRNINNFRYTDDTTLMAESIRQRPFKIHSLPHEAFTELFVPLSNWSV